jgi:Zn/Cd-binding protein ZinT
VTGKKRSNKIKRTSDGMRKEYDFSGGVRNKYANRFSRDVHYIAIDNDVMKYFKNPKAVNNALRALIVAIRAANGNTKAS